jgi:hypothetical protein
MRQSTNAKGQAGPMKLLVQLPCPECSHAFLIELKELCLRRPIHCARCRIPVSPDPDQTWELLRKIREEIRRICSEGGPFPTD